MTHSIGYAHISTPEQSTDLQVDALNAAGCHKIFTDQASGALDERPGLTACLEYLRPGDTLVVWRLDRLGRSVPHLLTTMQSLVDREIGFRSLTESIDTSSAAGRLILTIFAALSAFERELIRERTTAGLAAAKARGSQPGRPKAMTAQRLELARHMLAKGSPATDVARTLNIGRTTLYRYLAAENLASR